MGNSRPHNFYVLLAASVIASSLAGCFKDPRTSGDQMNNLAVSTVPGGPRFVKVRFQATNATVPQGSALGSFNISPPPTIAGVGNGVKAVRFFNEQDEPIQPMDVPWIEWVEVSISGGSGTGDSNCFRFANPGENNILCGGINCGAPNSYLRLSERDCNIPGPAPAANNIHIAVKFRKDPARLAPHENVQVALTYTASAHNPASTDPSACFDQNGVFSPQNAGCSDLTWYASLKENALDANQPFKLLIPPMTNLMTTLTNRRSGATTQTFVVPLAYNNIQHLVLSRTAGHIPAGANCVANSPGCVGIIFIDMTLMRI